MEVLAEEMDETGNEWIKNAGEPVRRQIVELCDQLITARTTKIILQEEELKKCLLFDQEKKQQQIINGNNKMKEEEENNNLSQVSLNERKWLNNLEAFGKWLNIMEKEVIQLQKQPLDLDYKKCQAMLVQLRDNCLEHFRLVSKFQLHQFQTEQQAKIANDLCERYKHLMEQFEQMQLPSAHLVPIRRTTTPSETCSVEFRHRLASQLSLASTSSSIGFSSDLDSDLASLNSEVIVAEALSLIKEENLKGENFEEENNVLNNLINKLETENKLEDIPIELIEKEVKHIQIAIDRLHARYYTPKPLEIAKEDVNLLKLFASKVTEQKTQLCQLASSIHQNETLKQRLFKLVASLKREKNSLKRFHKALTTEINQEIELRSNYKQIVERLGDVENFVVFCEGQMNPLNLKSKDNFKKFLQLQIELLKKQCRVVRQYVEISIDGSKCLSPSKQKKIILKLCNSVTTIIQVIDDKWQNETVNKQETEINNNEKNEDLIEVEGPSTSQIKRKNEEINDNKLEKIILLKKSKEIEFNKIGKEEKMVKKEEKNIEEKIEEEEQIFCEFYFEMKEENEEIEKKIKEVNNLKNIISKKIFEENKKQKNVVKKDDLKIKEKFEEKEEKAIIKQVATSSKYFVVTDPNVEIKVKKINKKEKAKSEPLNEKQLKSEKQTNPRLVEEANIAFDKSTQMKFMLEEMLSGQIQMPSTKEQFKQQIKLIEEINKELKGLKEELKMEEEKSVELIKVLEKVKKLSGEFEVIEKKFVIVFEEFVEVEKRIGRQKEEEKKEKEEERKEKKRRKEEKRKKEKERKVEEVGRRRREEENQRIEEKE
uniref:Nuclear anchorage protein 1 spectrin repeat domain-containing protein n=1 Tax=Meloidogyne enterolobii TaxID=390850 RepID=A0A6V7TW95_MELEN|nr:unnamed protein product [Meloidogyne enterolobii]